MGKAKNLVNELLVEVFNQILTIEEKILKKKGVELSMTEIHVLEAIRNVEPPTMSNVANRLRVTVGTLTTSIHTLVKKNYVIRKRDEYDKRIVLLELTDEAIDVLKIHDNFHDEMIDSVFKELKLDEDEVLIKSLERVSEYFKTKY
ncbi:MarR family winged helix-turn-helix transcriptional regulator [Haploplasma axanthum]|uniref:DNA-binding transcriptional repressor MarR n=1 Tax=Haploplasma axanthum TaxID=29552 RepID=A0A449BCC7_HAPAX|nr:MarR family transcriptional regulator [Haploplasma axanthum]VEU80086.1 DNA-binding transcriptional repressor MarR [Haploplasma axanthum]